MTAPIRATAKMMMATISAVMMVPMRTSTTETNIPPGVYKRRTRMRVLNGEAGVEPTPVVSETTVLPN